MSEFSELKKGFSKIANMERELHLKQLQIKGLLAITQAINNNIPAKELYKMYQEFLGWELGVKKMALFVTDNEGKWFCVTKIGIEEKLLEQDITSKFSKYERMGNLEEDKEDPFIKEFDVVIPVMHKETPIAYTFIGGFALEDDRYNKIQIITTITNIVAVAIENKRLFKRQIEQEGYKKEMELASQIQHLFLPSDFPKTSAYELAGIYKPHQSVGGDYFDFVELDKDTIAFCIADISGKGVAAALLMANFQASFRTLIKKRFPLEDLIRELNKSIQRITKGEKFLTFFVAEYNQKTRELIYINCGHNPPILLTKSNAILLDKGSTILGSFEELPTVEMGKEVVPSGEATVLTYTDGLTDVTNDAGEFYSEEMLMEFAKANQHKSATAFNETLMELINNYIGNNAFPDDFTVLTCKLF